jgi:hypothetical protein
MQDREFTVSSSIGLALQHQEPIPLISEFKKITRAFQVLDYYLHIILRITANSMITCILH